MYTSRGFDDKYEQWKEAFDDFMRTNEQIRYAREGLESKRDTLFGPTYDVDYTSDMLDKLEKENLERLINWKPEHPWGIPFWKTDLFDKIDYFD